MRRGEKTAVLAALTGRTTTTTTQRRDKKALPDVLGPEDLDRGLAGRSSDTPEERHSHAAQLKVSPILTKNNCPISSVPVTRISDRVRLLINNLPGPRDREEDVRGARSVNENAGGVWVKSDATWVKATRRDAEKPAEGTRCRKEYMKEKSQAHKQSRVHQGKIEGFKTFSCGGQSKKDAEILETSDPDCTLTSSGQEVQRRTAAWTRLQ